MTRIAAIQMTSNHHLDANLKTAERLIQQAHDNCAKLVALPENFAYMGLHENDKLSIKEPLGQGLVQSFLSEQAKKYGIYLLGGTLPISSEIDDKVYAASLLFDPNGVRISHYYKIHLFDVTVSEEESHKESNSVIAGNEIVDVETPIGHLGFSVCYDLRFPELFRKLNTAGAELLFVPSAFTHVTGKAHWEILLKARAIENLCYVVAPNQTGFHSNGRQSYGHSMIIDHWGQTINCLPTGEGVVLADIDLDAMHEKRKSFPAIEHRHISE